MVQEASEQASSGDSRRMARPLPSLIPVPQKRPSNLFAKSNPQEAKRYPSRPTAARPKSCGPLWPELQKPSALLTSSSATRAFSPGAQSTLISLEDFDRMVAINVRAAFVGIQAAAQEMNDGGRIVIIGSCTAIRTAVPGASVYSMTKAALVGLVRGAAIDLAPRAITVNNVQPGPTATDMSSAHAELAKTLIPLKRMGDVSEVASFVSYLASEEAGFITGASLTIDGGYVA